MKKQMKKKEEFQKDETEKKNDGEEICLNERMSSFIKLDEPHEDAK